LKSLSADLPLLSADHLAIMAAIPAVAGVLAWVARRAPRSAGPIRYALGAFLAVNELVWYGYQIWHGYFRFPAELPLQLCDIAVWLAAIAAVSRKAWIFDLAWYWGIAGSGVAVVTPDLWTPLPSFPAIDFFVSHGGVVATVLFLAWSGQARPRRGSAWRAFAAMNVYAAAVGIFDAAFHANYFYLREKPAQVSLLNYIGPWPVYIFAAEPLFLLAFWLLWLPFRRRRAAFDNGSI
jgi:hypothetical integral membrane protein (TIGR02206 family)